MRALRSSAPPPSCLCGPRAQTELTGGKLVLGAERVPFHAVHHVVIRRPQTGKWGGRSPFSGSGRALCGLPGGSGLRGF